MKEARLCKNCGLKPVHASGECSPCYMWRRNHNNEPRPIEVRIAYTRRVAERVA